VQHAAPDAACPCGSGETYGACCGPVLAGEPAPTPERLMRSRYTAFAVGDVEHLLASWHPSSRPRTLALDPELRWTGLTVLATSGGFGGSEGTVEFEARYDEGGRRGALHEKSWFVREGGRWLYVAAIG
jgi:SEC-C motif-containing protein